MSARRFVAWTALVALAAACGGRSGAADRGADAGADPAIGHLAPIGLPSAAPRAPASPVPIEEASEPTAEEAAQTPMPRFVPIVKDPSPASKLPCPSGTVLSSLERSVSCRSLHPKNPFHTSEGPALAFHPNGKLRSQGRYEDGEATGHFWFFTESGALDYEVDYVQGEYDGLYVSYYASGARRVESHEKHGKLDGVSKTWDEQGRLRSWSLYEGGRLVRQKFFR
jgi:hypothetical protein